MNIAVPKLPFVLVSRADVGRPRPALELAGYRCECCRREDDLLVVSRMRCARRPDPDRCTAMTASESHLAATVEDAPSAQEVRASAACCSCGHPILAWRDSLLPVVSGDFAVTERGELALRVPFPSRCDRCGFDLAEIRVEALDRARRS